MIRIRCLRAGVLLVRSSPFWARARRGRRGTRWSRTSTARSCSTRRTAGPSATSARSSARPTAASTGRRQHDADPANTCSRSTSRSDANGMAVGKCGRHPDHRRRRQDLDATHVGHRAQPVLGRVRRRRSTSGRSATGARSSSPRTAARPGPTARSRTTSCSPRGLARRAARLHRGRVRTVLATSDGGARPGRSARPAPRRRSSASRSRRAQKAGRSASTASSCAPATAARPGRCSAASSAAPPLDELGFIEALKNPGHVRHPRSSATTGIAVGDTGMILVSTDGGESWRERKLPDRRSASSGCAACSLAGRRRASSWAPSGFSASRSRKDHAVATGAETRAGDDDTERGTTDQAEELHALPRRRSKRTSSSCSATSSRCRSSSRS